MKRVLITAIGSFSADVTIRSCREMDMMIVGCDIYPMEWIANSLDVDIFYQALRFNDPGYIDFINQVCKENEIDFIIPLTDPEVDILSENREKLCAQVLISDDKSVKLCRNKIAFADAVGGIETHIVGEFVPEVYPVVTKPVDGRSSQGLRVVENAEEYALVDKNHIVQRYISGPIIAVDVCRHPVTGHVDSLAREELLRTVNGAGTSVKILKNKKLAEQCAEIAEKLGVCGTICLEFIRENVGDGDSDEPEFVYHPLECNPRFSGGIAFSSMAGYDFIAAHVAAFTMPDIPYMGKIKEQYIARKYVEYRM